MTTLGISPTAFELARNATVARSLSPEEKGLDTSSAEFVATCLKLGLHPDYRTTPLPKALRLEFDVVDMVASRRLTDCSVTAIWPFRSPRPTRFMSCSTQAVVFLPVPAGEEIGYADIKIAAAA